MRSHLQKMFENYHFSNLFFPYPANVPSINIVHNHLYVLNQLLSEVSKLNINRKVCSTVFSGV